LVGKENTFPRQGGELDTFSQAILANCLPREGRSQLPRGFVFRKPEPFDQDLQLAIIIPTMVEESFENELSSLLNLVAHLEESLGPKGPCPLAIPRRWCGGTSVMVTVSHKTSCHPSPKKQIGTPARLREPTRTPLLYSLPVTRSPRKTPEGAKREEGGENAVIFLWGSRATGAPLSP